VTQLPVLLLSELGVRDTRLLSMAYSAALFGLPTALYHLALARVRHDACCCSAFVIAAVAVVYLPTSFFIIGEYNATFAAVTAGMAVAMTSRRKPPGPMQRFFCVLRGVLRALLRGDDLFRSAAGRGHRLVAAQGQGSGDQDRGRHRGRGLPRGCRGLGWDHRRLLDPPAFHQGAVDELRLLAEPAVRHPAGRCLRFVRRLRFADRDGCRQAGHSIVVGVCAAVLASTPWWRLLHEHSILYPPAHYLAREAAGLLLALLLACMWLHVGWQRKLPRVLATLRLPAVSQRLVAAMTLLVIAAAIPDVMLTGLWSDYLGRMRDLVDSRQGIIRASEQPLLDWPDKLFAQDWSLPAMSAIVSRTPGRAFLRIDNDFQSNPPFDPACGTLPRLKGYGWR